MATMTITGWIYHLGIALFVVPWVVVTIAGLAWLVVLDVRIERGRRRDGVS